MGASIYNANMELADKWVDKALKSPQRVTSQLLKFILLKHGDKTFYNGLLVSMKKRSLGAGIYEIWFEELK
jgi:hypothetical protein